MTNDTITVYLTGRRPVQLVEADWPVASTVYLSGYDEMEVRLHRDGRAIVHGRGEFKDFDRMRLIRAGEIVAPGGCVEEAVFRVAEKIGASAEDVHSLLHQLPAEPIE